MESKQWLEREARGGVKSSSRANYLASSFLINGVTPCSGNPSTVSRLVASIQLLGPLQYLPYSSYFIIMDLSCDLSSLFTD